MKHRVIHRRRIREIRDLTRQVHVKGAGKNAEFATEKLGVVAVLEPGFDVFFLGETNPGYKPGQMISLVLEGTLPDAEPQSASQDLNNKDAPNR